MKHVARAEYEDDEARERDRGAVKTWHMSRGADIDAMCGRKLAPHAETRSDDAWGSTEEPFCHTCGALYLREVP
ncbi:hypothetical protein PJ985_03705 [Streptomyces sp. ACA25]|uniref:hypothetical protein n=1 Tax=Streptomyces sp. ACA25 TaxID=3022596 RepID=UPI0023073B5F|nr:hypothetical protein [Streptomyces sp. ACA25]MDB1086673.1 hypothetical protein [Streptomyces sp. ACA25]